MLLEKYTVNSIQRLTYCQLDLSMSQRLDVVIREHMIN